MHGARVAGTTCSIGSPPCAEVNLPQEARERRVPSLTIICSPASAGCACVCCLLTGALFLLSEYTTDPKSTNETRTSSAPRDMMLVDHNAHHLALELLRCS